MTDVGRLIQRPPREGRLKRSASGLEGVPQDSGRPTSRRGGPITMLPYFPRPLATVAPRDLLLWDFLQLSPSDSVLEIGVGTGSSIIRFAPRVREMHGADVATGCVQRLSAALDHLNGRVPNAKVFVQDFCDDALPLQRSPELTQVCSLEMDHLSCRR